MTQRRARHLRIAGVGIIVFASILALPWGTLEAAAWLAGLAAVAVFAGVALLAWRKPRFVGWILIVLSPLMFLATGFGAFTTVEWVFAVLYFAGLPLLAGVLLVLSARGQRLSAAAARLPFHRSFRGGVEPGYGS